MASQSFIYGVAAAITFGIQSLGFAAAYTFRTEVFYDVSKFVYFELKLHGIFSLGSFNNIRFLGD